MSRATYDMCPLCGGDLDPSDTNYDHVFGRAFGSHTEVAAHESCNTRFGDLTEKQLHRPDGYANLMRTMHGLQRLAIPGVGDQGEKVYFPTQQARGSRPRRVPRDRQQSTKGDFNLVLDLGASELFSIKAALGAGAVAFGEQFIASEVANALREWSMRQFASPFLPECNTQRMWPEGFDRLVELVDDTAMNVGRDVPPTRPARGSRTNQATFVPMGTTTIVFVHVLSTLLVPWGMVLDAPLTVGGWGGSAVLPWVVRELPGQEFERIDYTYLVMQKVADDATSAEEGIYPELSGHLGETVNDSSTD